MESIGIPFYTDLIIILISFLCGFLLGIERTRVAAHYDVRDHIFISVTSTVLVILHEKFFNSIGNILLYLIFGGIIVFLLIGSIHRLFNTEDPGYTTTFSMIIAMVVGILSFYYSYMAIVISVLFLIVLSTKKQFKKIRGLSNIEWTGTVEFIAIVLLLYILIPENITIGRLDLKAIIIVFISILVIKYFSYFFLKSSNENTIYYLSFFGGLAHSEATTIELSEAGASPSSIWLVIQTMLVRMLLILLIAPVLLVYALIPILITSALGLTGSFLLLRKHTIKFTLETIKNPLSLKSALIFTITYSLAVLISFLLEFLKLNIFTYYIITFLIGLVSGGASALFVTSTYLGGFLSEASSLLMLSIGLAGAIINKIFYAIRFLNEKEDSKKYSLKLLLYQLITIITLFSTTFINIYFQDFYFN